LKIQSTNIIKLICSFEFYGRTEEEILSHFATCRNWWLFICPM